MKTSLGGVGMQIIREPINSITHFIGMVAAILGVPFLLMKGDNIIEWTAISIFAIGLIGLYFTSSFYHGIKSTEKVLEGWRLADHIMIYILIAATYTPICLLALEGTLGLVLLAVIWTLTILGIIAKVLWRNMPRKLYTGLYVILGWAAVGAIYPLYLNVGLLGTLFLVFGGLSYTIGAVVYGKKPNFSILKFGFHEVFHLFILLGSAFHFSMIYLYVL